MTVLYESLCEDSQEFLKNLWPVFQEYHQCINLTLVPHGKSTRVSNGFKCQHGRQECWGNRMQNCALHSNLNQLQQMRFVACQMKSLKLVRSKSFKCAKTLHIENRVKKCMGKHDNKLQAEAARITDHYSYSEVPAIIFNGVFNESIQRSTRANVHQTLCNILKTKHLLTGGC
ncbi:GILT-like protein 1 isoform X2 [Drosophila innubila]|nr:GILT-like protein 1 isoform X2 [Drosophila innubila]